MLVCSPGIVCMAPCYNEKQVMSMKYKVVLHESEEGFAVSCPGLPGCWSQGATEAEAIENIQDASREYLAAADEVVTEGQVREVEVAA